MTEPRTTWGLVRYFLYLGSLGFGGPVALIGYMQRDLVERRAWFSKRDYFKGLVDRHGGNVSAAAREAKIDRKHLRDLLRKLGLREPDSN